MKTIKTLLLSFFVSCTLTSNAQTVNIPDAGFVDYLTYTFPSCMSGSLMDTTCADIVNATNVTIPNSYNVTDIFGIQFFDNLDTLDVYNNQISVIPNLPSDLLYLEIGFCGATSIANFPSTLETINMRANSVTSIPALPANLQVFERGANASLPIETSLPASLTEYGVASNNVTTLPPLPAGLLTLDISNNVGITIPVLPAGLQSIDISSLELTSFPPLPNTVGEIRALNNDFVTLASFPPNLTQLNLNGNMSLTTILNLPSTLWIFDASYCALTSIDHLPNSIGVLKLQNNNLNSIPNTPTSATSMLLQNNNLTSIPGTIPDFMGILQLENNSLYCLPYIPSSVYSLSLGGNEFTCITNVANAMNPFYAAFPVCQNNDPVNNPYGCDGPEGIEGNTYMDQNTNCTYETTDVQMKNVPIKINDNSGNTVVSGSSFNDGSYFFHLPPGQYNVEADTVGKPYRVDCIYPGADSSVTLTAGAPLVSNVNFGFECKPGFDVGTKSIYTQGIVFPGQPHTLVMKSGDLANYYNLDCASGIAGTVTVTVNGPVTFDNVSAGSLTPVIAGNVYTYTVADFGTINPATDFRLDFTTDTTAVAGDQVCVNVVVTPNIGDNNTVNNNFSICYEVVNSYDPNNKLVYPSSIEPGYDDYLTYTINFQNTGSAPAFNIRLEDTLSPLLDLSTFEVIDYSHDMHYNLRDDKLVVYYPDIMLVDSTTSEPDSKGYITFRIKPNGNTVVGDEIENTAHIFFDFNPAIITNTIVTAVEIDDAGLDYLDKAEVGVYPNPSSQEYFIVSDKNITEVLVMDQQGKRVDFAFDANQKRVDLKDNTPGIYFMQIVLDNQIVTKKLMKK